MTMVMAVPAMTRMVGANANNNLRGSSRTGKDKSCNKSQDRSLHTILQSWVEHVFFYPGYM